MPLWVWFLMTFVLGVWVGFFLRAGLSRDLRELKGG